MSIESRLGLCGIGSISDMAPDKNERYVLKNCIKYLQRHFNRFSFYDKETLEIICWVLGKDMLKIGDFLIDQIDNKQKRKFEEELTECDIEPDEYSRAVSHILRKIKSKKLNGFKRYILCLLEATYSQLKGMGKSEIEKNLKALKIMFNLTDNETEFSLFLFILTGYSPAEQFFVNHLECNKFSGQKYLTTLLELKQKDLEEILNGNLKKIGLYEMDLYDLKLENDFFKLFLNPADSDFSKRFFSKIQHSPIPIEYHLIKKQKISHIIALLKEKTETPTHILLYGPPGTGKSSFAYALTEQLNANSFEIVRGDENTTQKRRAALTACKNMTNSGNGSIIIVDEADNMLNTKVSWFMRGETQDKGWLNQLLEEPMIRMIWITNKTDDIEDSVLRRFAFSLHFKPFKHYQRIKLWENIIHNNKCKRYFDQSYIKHFAKKYPVNAGVIDLAVKKSFEANPDSKEKFSKAIELAIDAYITLLNSGKKSVNKNRIEKTYSLEGLNITGDLNLMMGQLRQFDQYLRNTDNEEVRNINLLFYGPPGTGKSEFARYIAESLDREIICKSVSDLHNMYVGQTEKNIRRTFEEAEAEEAILILDEVDSLLFNRDRAIRSWEISFTNEFLTHMEKFRGILICTTNRLKDLDDASLRRFSFKTGFNFLNKDGNVIFYEKLLSQLTSIPIDEINKNSLRGLDGLSPGDFKTIRDRFSFYPVEKLDHHILIKALKEEVQIKNMHNHKKRIGF